MRLSEIVRELDGKLIADGEFETLEYCTCNTDRKFLFFLENIKFINKINLNATCVLCKEELKDLLPNTIEGIFITDYPKEVFHIIHNELSQKEEYTGIISKNVIGNGCTISKNAKIASQNVTIGNNTIIEDNVVIYENVEIGENCIIHSGSIIGGKAFTFARGNGQILGLRDVGKVKIGDRVEICSLAHIAKGILPTDVTCIGDDVKIDAYVHIGHGACIGNRTMVAAGAIIGGNSQIGMDSWIGINATVSNRIIIGNNSRVNLGAVVTKDVLDNVSVTGNFAIDHRKFLDNLRESIK